MNIVPNVAVYQPNTTHVATESVRRDNQVREVIPEAKSVLPNQTDAKQTNDTLKERQQNSTEVEAQPQQKEDARVGEREQGNQQGSEQQRQQQQQLEQEQQMLDELVDRDTEVRAHEQAHAAVGGAYASAPSYDYQRGPDGKNYAVGGEVKIDISTVPNDPQATINKMQQVRAAALAPVEPSAADRAIASEASMKQAQAQAELRQAHSEQAFAKPASDGEEQASEPKRDQAIEARAIRVAEFYQQLSASSGITPSVNQFA